MQGTEVSVVADICQTTTIFLSLIAYIPQWRLMLKHRSSEHVALSAWCLWLMSSSLSLVYALVLNQTQGTAGALLLTTGINVCFLCFTIALIIRFRAERFRFPGQSSNEGLSLSAVHSTL